MNPVIDKAARFAAVKHDGHYRKGSNIPYITHPFGVAMILMEEKRSDSLIAAALLHDTLEDTDATEEELFKHFGEEILMLVKAASEPDKTLSWELRKQHTIANLPCRSTEELYLILADKLHNLRSVQADVLKQGDAVWSRFKRGKREQSWYYMSMVRALRTRQRDIPLIRKLEEEAMELFTGKKRLSVNDIQLLFTCFHSEEQRDREELERSGLAVFAGELRGKAEAHSAPEIQGGTISVQQEPVQNGSQQLMDQTADPYKNACLQELKYRLAWDDELYRKYVNDFYLPD